MAFNYNPDNASNCVPKGEYEGTLVGVEEAVSKNSGADMLIIHWKVYVGSKEIEMKDFVVDKPGALWKLRALAIACGQYDAFKAKTFDPSKYVGNNYTVTLDIQDDPRYGERNFIAGYAPLGRSSGGQAVAPAGKSGPLEPEDIPF